MVEEWRQTKEFAGSAGLKLPDSMPSRLQHRRTALESYRLAIALVLPWYALLHAGAVPLGANVVSDADAEIDPPSTRSTSTPAPLGTLPQPFPPVVPEPREWFNGTQRLELCGGGSRFHFVPPVPSSPDLEHMLTRYHALILPRSQRRTAALGSAGYLHPSSDGADVACEPHELRALVLVVSEPDADLGHNTDESYSLFIPPQTALPASALEHLRASDRLAQPASEGGGAGGLLAKLWAKTQVGALRGLETFSQLVTYDMRQRGYVIQHAPWLINDAPRFRHRQPLLLYLSLSLSLSPSLSLSLHVYLYVYIYIYMYMYI